MYVPAEQSTSTTASGRAGSEASQSSSSSRSIVTERAVSSGRAAGPGEGVGPATGDLDRGVVRGDLDDRPAKGRQGGFQGRPIEGRTGDRAQLAIEVVGRRGGTEADRRPVLLAIAKVVFDDPGGPSDEDRQDAPGEGVEGSPVADSLDPAQAADQSDDVVRGRPGRLVDHEDSVDAGRSGGRGHRRTTVIGRSRGRLIAGPARRAAGPRPGRPGGPARPRGGSSPRPPERGHRPRTRRSGPSRQPRPAWSER